MIDLLHDSTYFEGEIFLKGRKLSHFEISDQTHTLKLKK